MGHKHNTVVAWVRFWSALGAQIAADRVYAHGPSAEIARELAKYELRRLTVAIQAMQSTAPTGAQE